VVRPPVAASRPPFTSVAYRYKCRLYLNFRGSRICQIFGYIGGSLFISNSRQFPKVTFYIK